MEIPVLKVEQRESKGKGKAKQMRQTGSIPAVCYGKGIDPLPLTINPDELVTILRSARGLNSLIKLDGAEDRTVFVQELQRHPVERNLLHVDFLSVDEHKKIQRTVPIETYGTSVGIKQGGLLQLARHRLMVESLPVDLPEAIRIDITEMDIGSVLHVNELEMPKGVTVIFEKNFTICAVLAPTVEEEPEEEEGEEGLEGEEGAEGAEGAAEGAEGAAEEKKDGGEKK